MIFDNVSPTSNTLHRLARDKRLLLTALLILVLALSFWGGSRYPVLSEKAAMGADTRLGALGFDSLVPVLPGDPFIQQVFYTTLNWINTNRQGMTFGILIAPAIMLLLSLLKRRRYRSGIANTLLGVVIGTPLGVCVNCAAPIAHGLRTAGASVETMLASMFSSPTLNIIVITMLFAMFPAYMVLLKIGFTLGFILLLIPLLARFLPAREPDPSALGSSGSKRFVTPVAPDSLTTSQTEPNWCRAITWILRSYLSYLWFIVKTTVPLMLLAGFLGALLITLLPWETLSGFKFVSGALMTLLTMCAVAIVGVFLPVPIAFDIIIVAILLEAGMPVKYAMVLLFTLGIYSIYPLSIIWRTLSWQMALVLFVLLAGLGVTAGVAAHKLSQWDQAKRDQLFFETFGTATHADAKPFVLKFNQDTIAESDDVLQTLLSEHSFTTEPFISRSQNESGLKVDRIPFRNSSPTSHAQQFETIKGSEFGLTPAYSYSILSQIPPFSKFRGIASGDVHNDGWPDVLLTSEKGLFLYANNQGKGFLRQELASPEIPDLHTVNAALVDINDDGWLDIYFSTYRHGNHVIYNENGFFSDNRLHKLPNRKDVVMTAATAFGDIDQDGDLDVFLGNWSTGSRRGAMWSHRSSGNTLLRNNNGDFDASNLNTISGETLSVLLSDINNQNGLDLIVGNDFEAPDEYYVGSGAGDFRQILRGDQIVPASTWGTMSVTSADIDNDLQPEIYLAQLREVGDDAHETQKISDSVCETFARSENEGDCKRALSLHKGMLNNRWPPNVRACLTKTTPEFQRDCIGYHILQAATRGSNRARQDLCSLFPENWGTFAFVCQHNYRPDRDIPSEDLLSQSIPPTTEITYKNVLLTPTANGQLKNIANSFNVEYSGWSWNAKFADLDNDEWQDLYVANGFFVDSTRESNVFYQNREGRRFTNETEQVGLNEFAASSAYTYVDIDQDGDLDIILRTALGPVGVYINHASGNNAISFELRDHKGNRFGIGSKIIIYYGKDGTRHQMREIQAGGGFISFDAPVAHFGLGQHDKINHLEIRWSTGEKTTLSSDFIAGSRYVVTRS